jgi:hypothetical protein
MNAPDIFALGGRQDNDPVSALVDEYFRLLDAGDEAGEDDDAASAFFDQADVLQKRVVDMVPTTVSGVLALLRLLPWVIDFGAWSDDRDGRLYETILAGASRLGRAAP